MLKAIALQGGRLEYLLACLGVVRFHMFPQGPNLFEFSSDLKLSRSEIKLMRMQKRMTDITTFACGTKVDEILLCYRHATAAASIALKRDETSETRQKLWDICFKDLYAVHPHYQAQDFEIVDYDLHSIDGENLFRGPCPNAVDLKEGRYICLVGAAQFLGRFQTNSLQDRLASHFNLPVLNLSVPAAGPDFALSDKLRPLLENAKLTIVQVMSGRSVGCDAYPGGWKTTDRETGEVLPREVVLGSIWKKDKNHYREITNRWNDNYVSSYKKLAETIRGPKVLMWVSPRRPSDWSVEVGATTGDFGTFPQLIGQDTVSRISPLFDSFISVVHDLKETRFRSRITGKACPFHGPDGKPNLSNRYYPPESAQNQMFQAVEPVVAKCLAVSSSAKPTGTAGFATRNRPFTFETDTKGNLCFTTERGQQPKKAFVASLPKAGTYFLGEVLGALGWRDTEIHLSPFSLTDYRGRSLDEKLSKARHFSYPIGFDTGIQLVKPGQFTVGHIAFSGRNHRLLEEFKVLFAVRRWRDCLASFMHFEAKRIALDAQRHPEKAREWISRETPQEQFVGYLEVFGERHTQHAKSMLPWIKQDTISPVRFEDIVGISGKKAQEKCLVQLLEYLEIEPNAQMMQVVLDCINTPTLTFSGGRSNADELWSPEAQKLIQSFGGFAVEKRLGYD